MLDHMAEVDDPLFLKIRQDAMTPMSSQTMFNAADGSARCHQPLIAKPAAPKTFIAWYASDLPVSFPVRAYAVLG